MNESQSNFFLAEQPVGALMRKFSLPCILSLLVGALYNIVDQLFIANASYLGSYGNAANSVVFPLTVIALAIATMIGDGCCAYVSIRLGAGEQEQAHRSVGNAIVLTLIVSVVLMAVYLIFMDPILTAFGATVNAETFALSREYCFWIALGIPFYMFGQAMNPIIRSDGSPRYAMLSLLAGAVCNIILDPIFIFPCGWGMMGAAVATVIGQILSAVLAAAYLLHMKAVRLQRGSFRLRGELLRAFLPLGMTSFLSQISIVFSMAAVLNMCRKYGALDPVFGQAQYAQIPTAVVGIVMKLFQIVISIAIGLSAGCIPVVGYNIGAGRRDRARALLHRLLLAEAVVGLMATALFESCPGVFADLFGAKNESAYYTDFAVRCIRWFLGAAALSCVNKGAMIYLQALGKAWTSTALSLLRAGVVRARRRAVFHGGGRCGDVYRDRAGARAHGPGAARLRRKMRIKARPQALPAGGSAYPGLLAEEGDHTVEEIADGGDDVLDLAGEGRDLVLRAGELFERILHGVHLREQGVRVQLFERAAEVYELGHLVVRERDVVLGGNLFDLGAQFGVGHVLRLVEDELELIDDLDRVIVADGLRELRRRCQLLRGDGLGGLVELRARDVLVCFVHARQRRRARDVERRGHGDLRIRDAGGGQRTDVHLARAVGDVRRVDGHALAGIEHLDGDAGDGLRADLRVADDAAEILPLVLVRDGQLLDAAALDAEGLVDGLDLVVREVCADDGARLAGVNGRHGTKACEQAHGKYNGQGPFEKFHGVGFLSPRSMGCGALQDETLPL